MESNILSEEEINDLIKDYNHSTESQGYYEGEVENYNLIETKDILSDNIDQVKERLEKFKVSVTQLLKTYLGESEFELSISDHLATEEEQLFKSQINFDTQVCSQSANEQQQSIWLIEKKLFYILYNLYLGNKTRFDKSGDLTPIEMDFLHVLTDNIYEIWAKSWQVPSQEKFQYQQLFQSSDEYIPVGFAGLSVGLNFKSEGLDLELRFFVDKTIILEILSDQSLEADDTEQEASDAAWKAVVWPELKHLVIPNYTDIGTLSLQIKDINELKEGAIYPLYKFDSDCKFFCNNELLFNAEMGQVNNNKAIQII